jgi:hypothetical protein
VANSLFPQILQKKNDLQSFFSRPRTLFVAATLLPMHNAIDLSAATLGGTNG